MSGKRRQKKAKEGKRRQKKAKEGKRRQKKAKEGKRRQKKAKEGKRRQKKAKEGKRRQKNAKEGKRRQKNAKEGKRRQKKAKEGKRRQKKARRSRGSTRAKPLGSGYYNNCAIRAWMPACGRGWLFATKSPSPVATYRQSHMILTTHGGTEAPMATLFPAKRPGCQL